MTEVTGAGIAELLERVAAGTYAGEPFLLTAGAVGLDGPSGLRVTVEPGRYVVRAPAPPVVKRAATSQAGPEEIVLLWPKGGGPVPEGMRRIDRVIFGSPQEIEAHRRARTPRRDRGTPVPTDRAA